MNENTPNAGAAEAGLVEAVESLDSGNAANAEAGAQEGAAEAGKEPTAAEKKAIEKEIRKLKIKFEGKEEELPEDEIIKLAQMGKLGTKKAQEKAELEKNVGDFLERLQKDPFEVLADPKFGIDVKQAIVKYIEKQVAEEAKSPEQKKQEEMAQELERLRKEKQDLEEGTKRERLAREQEKAAKEIDDNIQSAIQQSGLPNSAYVVKRFADFMLSALENNLDVKPIDIAGLVRKEIQEDIKQMFGAAPDELVEEFIGKDRLGGMKKKKLAEVQKTLAGATPPKDTGSKPETPSQSQNKMSVKEFFKLKNK